MTSTNNIKKYTSGPRLSMSQSPYNNILFKFVNKLAFLIIIRLYFWVVFSFSWGGQLPSYLPSLGRGIFIDSNWFWNLTRCYSVSIIKTIPGDIIVCRLRIIIFSPVVMYYIIILNIWVIIKHVLSLYCYIIFWMNTLYFIYMYCWGNT